MINPPFYRVGLVLLILGIVVIILEPEPTLVAFSVAIPAAVAMGLVSTLYLGRVYLRQPLPRSRFFRMLVESFLGLMIVGVWVGYLSLARILDRARIDDPMVPAIPAPPPAISAPISALLVVLVLMIPVRFALEVYRLRRSSAYTLDRETHEAHEVTRDLDPVE